MARRYLETHSSTSFHTTVGYGSDDRLLGDATTAERGKPQGPPAVARINQRLRIRRPGWLYVIAVRVSEPASPAVVQVAQPQMPIAAL